MRKMKVIVIAALITAGVGLGWLVLKNQPASAPESRAEQPANEGKENLDPKEHNFADIDFAKKMIIHSQQGIQMAEIAHENATDEEVRQLVAAIRINLVSNNAYYKSWLVEWKEEYLDLSYFPEVEGHDSYPTHPGMASLRDLRALENATGSLVDELFLRLMIAHHEGAAEIAGMASERMQYGEMVSLKNKTLNNQSEEVERMKQLQNKGR